MNIRKTNPNGCLVFEIERNARSVEESDKNDNRKHLINGADAYELSKDYPQISFPYTLLYGKSDKIIRVSKQVIENAKLINFKSIKENIQLDSFDFVNVGILLDNDESGAIRIVRVGSDFHFIFYTNITLGNVGLSANTYSFLTGEFQIEDKTEKSNFAVQLISYIYFGDIIEKHLKAGQKSKINFFQKIVNDTKIDITYVDSLWKQRISTDGFSVSGHFRLQPVGEGRKERKLIWIEEFSKDGYNRKATRELVS